MSPNHYLVKFDGVSLLGKGRTLSVEILPGEKYAVMGQAAGGKTNLLDLFTGDLRPERGQVDCPAKVVRPNAGGYSRRATPATVAKANTKANDSAQIVSILTALRLWDVRDATVSKLTPSHTVAVDLLPCFLQSADLVVIDGHLDLLDPWTIVDLLELVDQQCQEGRTFLIATGRPDIAEALGNLFVVKDNVPRFAGTCRELIEQTRPAELVVELEDESTVRTMVDPFTVSVKASRGRLDLTAHHGQTLAAHLLTLGYGNVKSVVLREPTLAEALLAL